MSFCPIHLGVLIVMCARMFQGGGSEFFMGMLHTNLFICACKTSPLCLIAMGMTQAGKKLKVLK